MEFIFGFGLAARRCQQQPVQLTRTPDIFWQKNCLNHDEPSIQKPSLHQFIADIGLIGYRISWIKS
jgi:hypothetical protein